MEIAVAGGGGAIGRELVRTLVKAGHRVRAIAGGPATGVPAGALSGCDGVVAVASRLALRPAAASLYRAPFSAGIGWFASPAEREALAERAVGPLADAAVAARVRRFVVVSTAAVHGAPDSLPTAEGDRKAPASEGADRIWQLERRVFLRHVDRGLPLAVLRPALVYGPGVRGPVLALLAHLALASARGRRPPGVRRGPVVHLVHVEDVARAAAFLLGPGGEGAADGRAFFVADETPLPLEEVLAAAAAGLGVPAPGPRLPYLPRLARLVCGLGAALPRGLAEEAFRAALRGWRTAARRHGVAGALRVPATALLAALGHDHYYDGSRLAALGFVPAHPSAPEGLADFARALVASGALPGPLPRPGDAPAPGAAPPAGVTIPPGSTATALP